MTEGLRPVREKYFPRDKAVGAEALQKGWWDRRTEGQRGPVQVRELNYEAQEEMGMCSVTKCK